MTRGILAAGLAGALGLGAVAVAAPSGRAATVRVKETEYRLALPKGLSLRAGQRLALRAVNGGTIAHALSVSGPGLGEKSTANLPPGAATTLSVTLTKPGRYTVWCPIGGHRQLGMVTHLTVTR